MHTRGTLFIREYRRKGDTIKVFATVLKLAVQQQGNEERKGWRTARVSNKRWNHIKDEGRDWNSRETEKWHSKWKTLKADNLLDLVRQGNHQVQDKVLLFTTGSWKISRILHEPTFRSVRYITNWLSAHVWKMQWKLF